LLILADGLRLDELKVRKHGILTGKIRSPVDKIWDTFWSGAISNPLELINQITELLFLRLDKFHTLEEMLT